MKTLREYEISRPWPRSRSRAASAISSGQFHHDENIAAIAAGRIV